MGIALLPLQNIMMLTMDSNQWSGMFPSRSTDVGSSLPLWAVQFDYKPGVSTTTTFMGGWTRAYAKQYNLGKRTSGGRRDMETLLTDAVRRHHSMRRVCGSRFIQRLSCATRKFGKDLYWMIGMKNYIRVSLESYGPGFQVLLSDLACRCSNSTMRYSMSNLV